MRMKILIPAILLTAFFAVPAQAFYGNYNDPYYLDYMVGHAGYNNYYGYDYSYDYNYDSRYHYYDEYDHSTSYGYNDYYNSSNYYYYPSTYYPTYSYGYTPSRSNNWSYCDSVLPGSQLDDGKCGGKRDSAPARAQNLRPQDDYRPSRSNWTYCDSILPGSQLDDGSCRGR